MVFPISVLDSPSSSRTAWLSSNCSLARPPALHIRIQGHQRCIVAGATPLLGYAITSRSAVWFRHVDTLYHAANITTDICIRCICIFSSETSKWSAATTRRKNRSSPNATQREPIAVGNSHAPSPTFLQQYRLLGQKDPSALTYGEKDEPATRA